MVLTAPVGKQFPPAPKGNHVARLYQIVHIGTVPTTWQGQEKLTDKIRFTFELCNEKTVFKEDEPEKPFSVSREFTLSMTPKANLRPFIEGMIGSSLTDSEAETFDIESLLGTPCLLQVVHEEGQNGRTYANVKNASELIKGMTAPDMVNDGKVIDVSVATLGEIENLPGFLRDKMKTSVEYKQRFEKGDEPVDDFSGIPF